MPVKFAAAGRTDSRQFALAEAMLAHMESRLALFQKHMISVPEEEWDEWLEHECRQRRWRHSGDVLIFRELVDRGGEALYLGGLDDLYDYAKDHYNMDPVEIADDVLGEIQMENSAEEFRRKDLRDSEHALMWPDPIVVCVTAATHDAAYYVLQNLLCPDAVGSEVQLGINLLVNGLRDLEHGNEVARDMEDCAVRHVQWVRVLTESEGAFENAHYVVVMDQPERPEQEERESNRGAEGTAEQGRQAAEDSTHTGAALDSGPTQAQLGAHIEKMREYAQCMKDVADVNVRVVVAGRHANAAARAICSVLGVGHDPDALQQVVTMASLREQHAKNVISKRINVRPQQVVDLVGWGDLDEPCSMWIGKTASVYLHVGGVSGPKAFKKPVDDVMPSAAIVLSKIVPQAVRDHSRKGDCASAIGKAVMDVLQPYLWWPSVAPQHYNNSFITVGLASQGQYNVPKGMVFGFPAAFDHDSCAWTVQEAIDVDSETQKSIADCVTKLEEDYAKL